VVRLKEDGSLDYRPATPSSRPLPARTAEELDQMRDELIEELVRDHPGMSRDEATKRIDAFF
jgi:hypothetical protein